MTQNTDSTDDLDQDDAFFERLGLIFTAIGAAAALGFAGLVYLVISLLVWLV